VRVEEITSNVGTHKAWPNTTLVDEGAERHVVIALVAAIVAWLTLFVISLI
jgi:hypothetical protein